jgi:hypothetical protein
MNKDDRDARHRAELDLPTEVPTAGGPDARPLPSVRSTEERLAAKGLPAGPDTVERVGQVANALSPWFKDQGYGWEDELRDAAEAVVAAVGPVGRSEHRRYQGEPMDDEIPLRPVGRSCEVTDAAVAGDGQNHMDMNPHKIAEREAALADTERES